MKEKMMFVVVMVLAIVTGIYVGNVLYNAYENYKEKVAIEEEQREQLLEQQERERIEYMAMGVCGKLLSPEDYRWFYLKNREHRLNGESTLEYVYINEHTGDLVYGTDYTEDHVFVKRALGL